MSPSFMRPCVPARVSRPRRVLVGLLLIAGLAASATGAAAQGGVWRAGADPRQGLPDTRARAEALGDAASDRAVLEAFYRATGGPNWTDSTNWLSGAPLGEWHGVTTDTGRVTELDLRQNNLSGAIPAALGDLIRLEWLNLRRNQLSGSIPAALGNLVNLETLLLSEFDPR